LCPASERRLDRNQDHAWQGAEPEEQRPESERPSRPVGKICLVPLQGFVAEPIVISLPHLRSIQATDGLKNDKFTFVIAGTPGSKRLESIRKRFQEDKFFWVSEQPLDNVPINGYRPTPPEVAEVPAENWPKIGPAAVDISGIGPLLTYDWPFLYLRAAFILA
jgi:hypothetical protein